MMDTIGIVLETLLMCFGCGYFLSFVLKDNTRHGIYAIIYFVVASMNG
jgi:hypothetical protein